MINVIHIKNDFHQIFRNPMMVMFFALPVFLPVLFKLLIVFLLPFLSQYVNFDLSPYYSYVFAATVTFAPMSLGIITGFMMIDDKDGRIYELMRVTPLGAMGYLFNRMVFSMAASFVCTYIVYFVLNIYYVPFFTLLFVALLMSVLSVVIALCLFLIATDKVKGLTYAKALNIFSLFTLADLLGLKWLSAASHAVPTYWVTKIVQAPGNVLNILLAFVVCFVWLGGVFWVYRRREE